MIDVQPVLDGSDGKLVCNAVGVPALPADLKFAITGSILVRRPFPALACGALVDLRPKAGWYINALHGVTTQAAANRNSTSQIATVAVMMNTTLSERRMGPCNSA
jgi:hypothetical protein